MGATLLSIALLHWVALISPGPNMLVVSTLAANDSRRSAICAALGVAVVAGLWSSLAVLGIHAVFAAHPVVRAFVQVAGGCYLLYLGLRLWRTGGVGTATAPMHLSPAAAFRLGFLTNALNPKAVLFFSSVFATALPVDSPAQLLVPVVMLVIFNALAWYMFLALAFSQRQVQSAYARSRKTISRCSGVLLGFFGARLLIASAVAGLMGSDSTVDQPGLTGDP